MKNWNFCDFLIVHRKLCKRYPKAITIHILFIGTNKFVSVLILIALHSKLKTPNYLNRKVY